MGKSVIEALLAHLTENDNALLIDYEQAAEDARYRDRMLHTSYYLSLIFFVLILGVLAQVVNSNSPSSPLVLALAAFGFIATVTIGVWIVNIRGARDASSERREEIESKVYNLRSHKSWDKRCKTRIERRHPSNLFYILLGLSALFWLSVFGWYLSQIF